MLNMHIFGDFWVIDCIYIQCYMQKCFQGRDIMKH